MPMITLADVRAAADRIAGRVIRTPALRSDVISRAVDTKRQKSGPAARKAKLEIDFMLTGL